MSNNVQSYIANISVSKTFGEIINLFENTKYITALDYFFEKNAFFLVEAIKTCYLAGFFLSVMMNL